MNQLPAEIFKAYDIRGIVGKSLTAGVVRRIGHALGSLAAEQGQTAIAVGRDGRLSGPELAGALIDGICAAGCDAIDIGCVPTPVTYFAASSPRLRFLRLGHRQPQPARLQRPQDGHRRHDAGPRRHPADQGARRARRPQARQRPAARRRRQGRLHRAHRFRRRLARPLKIVMDCGNGVAGAVAPELFARLGCEIVPLFCEVDGSFPNHHPDPSKPENLADVIRALRETDAEIGIAFDGDGDRLGVVTKDGEIIYPDRQLMLFAADVLARVPGGQIIYDVKCTRLLAPWIRQHGGQPLMWNTGHALVKAKLKETAPRSPAR
jgi:phosphomannomutase/phosphoglucomutase